MPYFKDKDSKIHFFSREDLDALALQAGLEEGYTDADAAAVKVPTAVAVSDQEREQLLMPSNADLWAAHQAAAELALNQSDITIMRCVENAVTVPPDWRTYRAALRAIVSASSGQAGQLPVRPAFPQGT